MDNMLDLLRTRRSIRKFDAKKEVPHETLERIIEAGHIAPSACNRQPWHFYLIRSEERSFGHATIENGYKGPMPMYSSPVR